MSGTTDSSNGGARKIDVRALTKFAASGRALRLVMDIAAALERYKIVMDLPEMANPATLRASLENGILSVTVAKRPETQARRIEIARGALHWLDEPNGHRPWGVPYCAGAGFIPICRQKEGGEHSR